MFELCNIINFKKYVNFTLILKLYTRYPIVARALGLATAFSLWAAFCLKAECAREQRNLAYNQVFKQACLITLHSNFEIFQKGYAAVEVMLDRRIFER